jgi:type VI secretion system protein ImpL
MIWLARLFGVAALAGFAAAVWYAGPLISFNDERILEGEEVRLCIIGAAVALVAAYYAFRLRRDRYAQKALEAAIAGSSDTESDSQVLEERMAQAIDALKTTYGRRNFLYELPWYLIIGPPGAGKTTALVNSGLHFPLAGSGTAQPVAGVGGTRYCDWWFTEDAVLIDTAGRYTTQDSDARRDKSSWLAFLGSLKRHRPTQPFNGVILAISLHDLMTLDGQELGAHVAEIRNRLQEIHDVLKIEFPVYVVFTKADLIIGFMEYFAAFDEARRRQVWGTTFQTDDRTRNMVDEAPAGFDSLVARLSEDLPDRLSEEPDPRARIAIFGFPIQFASLKDQVTKFLKGVFDPARHHIEASLRGFYFTSGTQQGTPIDQLLASMERSFDAPGQAQMSGTGRSFFLHDLLQQVVFPEAGWVSSDRQAQRRVAVARFAGLAMVVLVGASALGAIGWSFLANQALVASTGRSVDQYRALAAPHLAAATVADTELENVIGALDAIRELPVGYGARDVDTPVTETFGLSQRERLQSASETAYRRALERMLRSRLLLQLEQVIDQVKGDASLVYEPLKVYLMLGGKAPKADSGLVVSWFVRDWEQNRYPGAPNRSGREQLEKHLRAMLELDDAYEPVYPLNQPLIEAAQRSLGQLSLAERAGAIVRSAYHSANRFDFQIAQNAGGEAQLVLATTDGSSLSALRVPGIYTPAGFDTVFVEEMSKVAQNLVEDRWVFGAGGAQADIEADLQRVGPELVDRYAKEYVAAWHAALDRLKLKDLTTGKPEYLALSSAASPSSPILRLFEAAAGEMVLTRERFVEGEDEPGTRGELATQAADRARGLARIGLKFAALKSQNRAGFGSATTAEPNPVAAIEAQLRPFVALVSGAAGQRPVDVLTQNFRDILQSLRLADSIAGQNERASANLRLQISNLRANASRLPRGLSRMVRATADEFEGQSFQASISQLSQSLDQLAAACNEVIANRYPFSAESAEDLSLQDFARVFGPGGMIDLFFARELSSMVDMSGPSWRWKQDARLARGFSDSSLKQFQLASEIRDAYFPARQSLPLVRLNVTPFSLHGEADTALLDVDGQVVESLHTGSSPTQITWPGDMRSGSARLSLVPELPGRDSSLSFEGPWALKRLLDRATVSRNGAALELRFLIGGRDVAYVLDGTAANPFALPALASFGCPQSL